VRDRGGLGRFESDDGQEFTGDKLIDELADPATDHKAPGRRRPIVTRAILSQTKTLAGSSRARVVLVAVT
jgi:hypothetical protein